MKVPESILNHYNSCLKNNTDPLLQVDWTNKEAAKIRYKIIRKFYSEFNKIDNIATILDFGSGLGELTKHLPHYAEYSGMDASWDMVYAAAARFTDKPFYHYDGYLLQSFDVVAANGVFTEKRDVCYSDMLDYVVAQLKILWKHTNKGLIFNFMNYHKIPVDQQYDTLFFVDYSLLDSILREVGISRYIIDNSHKELNDYFVKCYKD